MQGDGAFDQWVWELEAAASAAGVQGAMEGEAPGGLPYLLRGQSEHLVGPQGALLVDRLLLRGGHLDRQLEGARALLFAGVGMVAAGGSAATPREFSVLGQARSLWKLAWESEGGEQGERELTRTLFRNITTAAAAFRMYRRDFVLLHQLRRFLQMDPQRRPTERACAQLRQQMERLHHRGGGGGGGAGRQLPTADENGDLAVYRMPSIGGFQSQRANPFKTSATATSKQQQQQQRQEAGDPEQALWCALGASLRGRCIDSLLALAVEQPTLGQWYKTSGPSKGY